MGLSFAARGKLAIAAGIGAALAFPLIATLYWDVRCRGADDLCVLGYLIWLIRSLIGGPVIGTGVAALLAPADRRWRAGFIALGVAAPPLWTLLSVGHLAWGW